MLAKVPEVAFTNGFIVKGNMSRGEANMDLP
jgi:hypothetical protein